MTIKTWNLLRSEDLISKGLHHYSYVYTYALFYGSIKYTYFNKILPQIIILAYIKRWWLNSIYVLGFMQKGPWVTFCVCLCVSPIILLHSSMHHSELLTMSIMLSFCNCSILRQDTERHRNKKGSLLHAVWRLEFQHYLKEKLKCNESYLT